MNAVDIPADWTFKNSKVAATFDRHVREQLPWYDIATGAVTHIARHYIPEEGIVYDVGASTGNIGIALADILTKRRVNFRPIDSSAEMCERYAGPGKIIHADATNYEFEPFDVAICFLVLMFMQPARRSDFLRKLEHLMNPGGALIIFDKLTFHGGYISTMMHRLTIAGKVATGCDPAEIIAKELSLSGVQRPMSERFIYIALPNAVEFFRFGEFAGWIIEKAE